MEGPIGIHWRVWLINRIGSCPSDNMAQDFKELDGASGHKCLETRITNQSLVPVPMTEGSTNQPAPPSTIALQGAECGHLVKAMPGPALPRQGGLKTFAVCQEPLRTK